MRKQVLSNAQNNFGCIAWRNNRNTGDDFIGFNSSDQLAYSTLSCPWCVVAVEDALGNLFIPGTLANTFGGIGTYQNLILDSTFQTPTGGHWTTASGSTSASTLTANTTDVTDPLGGSTAEKAVQFSWSGSADQGQAQASISVTSGKTYTISVFARGAIGGETFSLEYFQGSGNCNSPGATTLTNAWQRCAVTCTALIPPV